VLHVQRQAAFAAVEPREPRGRAADDAVVGASEVAFAAALDLDDVGAEVAEVTAAKRRRDRLLEGDDSDASQGK